LKADIVEESVTKDGNAFQTRAQATGKEQSPIHHYYHFIEGRIQQFAKGGPVPPVSFLSPFLSPTFPPTPLPHYK